MYVKCFWKYWGDVSVDVDKEGDLSNNCQFTQIELSVLDIYLSRVLLQRNVTIRTGLAVYSIISKFRVISRLSCY